MKLLIVEDDENILQSLRGLMLSEGFLVEIARNVREALVGADASIDLIILDWTLPDGQGVHLIKTWRQSGFAKPIIMLTARTELIDKVLGLEIGADDYVTKPFEPRELLARISARLRAPRSAAAPAQALSCENVSLNLQARRVLQNNETVELTKLEFELLKLFFEYPNQAFSRDELLNRVWGFENFPTTRTVDTHILQLRHKFPKLNFETIRGIGYRLEKK